MYLNRRMDAGDIILQREVGVDPEDTGGTLHDRLATVGAELLAETVRLIREGAAVARAQDEAAATYAPKLTKADGRIDWRMPAAEVCDRVRAFNPWPCCTCEVPRGSGKLLRVLRAKPEAGTPDAEPGVVLGHAGALVVRAGDGAVRLLEVQPEGRKAMTAEAYLLGHPLRAGDRLG